MYFSKYNILSGVKGSDHYFILNPLTKSAHILTAREAEAVQKGELEIEGYFFKNEEDERKCYNRSYLNFQDTQDNSEIQIFFVPTYECNFACSYCYQDEYAPQDSRLNQEVINAFYRYIDTTFENVSKYITIFGGEPLLPGNQAGQNITYLLEKAKERNIETAIVTNGYTLEEFAGLLKKYAIREIQVTLDGLEETHDRRRPHKSGKGSFKEIVRGIDAVLAGNIPVNLRLVLDKENIDELPGFAAFAVKKGWAGNPLFQSQLGRNYELHHCQEENSRLFSRISMYEAIYSLLQTYPEIADFHRPAYSISRYLFDTGEVPEPLFNSCPGCKTEWAFDYTGKIFSCTATVGKAGEELGTFFPGEKRNDALIEQWEERDVTSIAECKECTVQLACGGGCAAVAKNRTGTIGTADCRPIKELMEMGIAYYFKDEIDNG